MIVMQRMLLLLSILFALYACSSAPPVAHHAAKPVPATVVAPVAVAPKPAPIEVPLVAPEPVVTQPIETLPMLEEQEIVLDENALPHIALLLPLQDKDFSESALAVRDGFMAAASLNERGLPVLVYNKFDENSSVVAAYRKALAHGAQAVVGPLTRNGVSALAAEKNIPVPTLALNSVDARPADNLYFFSLSADTEARNVAELAAQQNLHQAIVISSSSPLAQRIQFAFEEAWSKSGRNIVREIEFKDDSSILSGLVNAPDTLVFLATDAQKARQIRPYLPNKLPTYGTSQLFVGNDDALTNYDLNGIRFVDMPWLLQPDHPAVLMYPHSTTPLAADKERLYALGIDAYRLVQLMLAHRLESSLPLDGVTGQIQLDQHTLQRTAVAGVFTQGRAQSTEAVAAPAIQMFPDQFKIKP
jgi:outer membrane PBP1 activator LpoA protein